MVAGMHVQRFFDLTGRAAVVTGGERDGRGPRRAGAAVYFASRDRTRCERVAADSSSGLDATGLEADVAVEAEVDALVAAVVRESMGAST